MENSNLNKNHKYQSNQPKTVKSAAKERTADGRGGLTSKETAFSTENTKPDGGILKNVYNLFQRLSAPLASAKQASTVSNTSVSRSDTFSGTANDGHEVSGSRSERTSRLDNSPHLSYNLSRTSPPKVAAANTANTSRQQPNTADYKPKRYIDMFNFGIDGLRNNRQNMQTYLNGLGGVNYNAPDNTYHILYGTWDQEPIDYYGNKKDSGPNNRYDNYNFDIHDAINWLVQTGGNTNFVLQMRDINNKKDSNQNFDDWAVKDITADWQAYMINTFIEAANILQSCGENVKIPKFYLGAAEKNPTTLLSDNGRAGIYEQVLSKLGDNRDLVAGAYYGEDINWDTLIKPELENKKKNITDVTSFIHNNYGGKTLFIPFYDIGGDGSLDKYFERAETISNLSHDFDGGSRAAFDTILFQPGTYYYDAGKGLSFGDIISLTDKINAWNSGGNATTMGMELEYDMGVVTGRDDENYSLRNTDKKKELLNYLLAAKNLNKGTPIGIYSGGPNEQGYANPLMNANRHNTGNHIVQDSNRSYATHNGTPYNQFPHSYDGNFVYDMNNYVLRDFFRDGEMDSKLKRFLEDNNY